MVPRTAYADKSTRRVWTQSRTRHWRSAPGPMLPPRMHAFTRGLDCDRPAVDAGLTQPFHNGGTEGVNTKIKMIKRQMYGRASFTLLRHRVLLH